MNYGKNTEQLVFTYIEKIISGFLIDEYIPYLAATPGDYFFHNN